MATSDWKGIGADILQKYLKSESGEGAAEGSFGLDVFVNGFEDEFPSDADDPIGGNYVSYSIEAERAAEARPWGGKFGDRPKIHELNQPPAAQVLGWRVIDFYPNRDVKSEFYRLAGTPSELRIMMQIVQATRFATGTRINFEQWFEAWELGFPDFKEDRADSNFLLNGEKQWERIKNPQSRPRYRNWTKSQQQADLGYRVIEYWRDRSNESESIVLSGTSLQLIQHIIQIEYEASGGGGAGLPGKNSKPILKGWPAIVLTFLEPNDRVRRKPNGAPRSRVTGEKIIRCVGYSDDREIIDRQLAELVRESDIRRWATRIREEFASPLYRWEKGRGCLSYSGQIARMQGLEGYAYVRSAQQGKDLFGSLLKIFDFAPDPTGFKFSTNEVPEQAFSENPSNFQLLGKEWEAETQRPQSTVVFDSALLYLPSLRSPIPLVKGTSVIYNA